MLRYDLKDGFVNDTNDLPKTLEAAKDEVVKEIEKFAAVLRGKIVGNVSPYEAASWGLKLSEAKGQPGPLLTEEAKFRKVPVKNIVDRVLANYEAWAVAESVIAGNSGLHKDTVRSLERLQEVLDYDWREGWPK